MEDGGFVAKLVELSPFLSRDAKNDMRALSGILESFPGRSLTEVGKQVDAMMGVMRLFPGQSPAEVEKSVKLLVQRARTSVPVIANRAQALCDRSATETLDQLLGDAGKLSAADFKKVGKKLQIDLSGTKSAMLEDLRAWIDSGGTVKPPTAKEKEEQLAAEYVVKIKPLMSHITATNVDEILNAADAAYKALKVDGFRAFATNLGVPVSGGKAAMKKQFRDFVKRLAVTETQTQF